MTYSDIKPVYSNSSLRGYEIVNDIEAVRNSLMNIFLVQKGEVPGKPKFGNPIRMKIFDLMDSFGEETIKTAIENEVHLYDPRINIKKVEVIKSPEYNRIVIEIHYEIILYNKIYVDTLYIPFTHNTMSYIGMRETFSVDPGNLPSLG